MNTDPSLATLNFDDPALVESLGVSCAELYLDAVIHNKGLAMAAATNFLAFAERYWYSNMSENGQSTLPHDLQIVWQNFFQTCTNFLPLLAASSDIERIKSHVLANERDPAYSLVCITDMLRAEKPAYGSNLFISYLVRDTAIVLAESQRLIPSDGYSALNLEIFYGDAGLGALRDVIDNPPARSGW